MEGVFMGMYVCGSILLTLALLGFILTIPVRHIDRNSQSWEQLQENQRKRAELEAELEELGKE